MRTGTRPVGALVLLAALALAGCSGRSADDAGDGSSTAPATSAPATSSAPDDPDDPDDPGAEEPPSKGGAGGGEVVLVGLPVGGGGPVELDDGVGCVEVFGASEGVRATVEQVVLEPSGTALLPGACGSDHPACAGLVDSSSYSCAVRFRAAPGATGVEVGLLGTLACDDAAVCAELRERWGPTAGGVPFVFVPAPGPSEAGSTEPEDPGASEPADEPGTDPTGGG